MGSETQMGNWHVPFNPNTVKSRELSRIIHQNMHISDNIFTSINTRHSLLTKQEPGAQMLDPARELQSSKLTD